MKQMALIEMDGFLKGKCIPSDLKVNETNAEYLVRKFAELESKLETALRECRSAGITIDNLEAKCAALAAKINVINELMEVAEQVNKLAQEETEKLAHERNTLAAENAGLKSVIEYCINPDNQPEYHDQGMGCGVEDHGYQRDGYSACYYGWESAMERVYSEVIPDAIPETPATDAFLAEVKTEARKEGAYFVANRMLAAWEAGFIDDTAKNAADIARMIITSTEFMANAPEGDFDRSFSDGVLEDIAAQLRKGASL
ncbi:hNH endonuclease [Escherichia coli]|nr:hNH endonuclease [Escherichia coli]